VANKQIKIRIMGTRLFKLDLDKFR